MSTFIYNCPLGWYNSGTSPVPFKRKLRSSWPSSLWNVMNTKIDWPAHLLNPSFRALIFYPLSSTRTMFNSSSSSRQIGGSPHSGHLYITDMKSQTTTQPSPISCFNCAITKEYPEATGEHQTTPQEFEIRWSTSNLPPFYSLRSILLDPLCCFGLQTYRKSEISPTFSFYGKEILNLVKHITVE